MPRYSNKIWVNMKMNKKLTIHITNTSNKYRGLSAEVKATIWFFVCNILQNGISMLTIPIFTRLLSTEEYGIYSSYTSWLNIFAIFTTFKLNYGVFNKGMTKYKNQKAEYTATMQTITSMLSVVFGLSYLFFQDTFNSWTELPTAIMILMIVELLFNPAISFWSLYQRYELKYKSVVIISLLISLVNPLLGIVAVWFSQERGIARILSCIVVDIFFGVILYVHNIRKSKAIFKLDIAKFALTFNMPLIPHYLAEYILDQSDRIMIQKMCDNSELGLYSIAYSTALVVKILVSSLNNTLIPWLYKSLEADKKKAIQSIINISCILVGSSIVFFILVVPEILLLLAPSSYQKAVKCIPPIASSVFFVYLFGIYGNIEFYFNKNRFTMYVSSISAVINVFLNYIFIPRYGYVAAAFTTLFCYMILTIMHAVFIENVCKKELNGILLDEKKIWTISIALSMFSIFLTLIYDNRIIRYGIVIILFLSVVVNRERIKKRIHMVL